MPLPCHEANRVGGGDGGTATGGWVFLCRVQKSGKVCEICQLGKPLLVDNFRKAVASLHLQNNDNNRDRQPSSQPALFVARHSWGDFCWEARTETAACGQIRTCLFFQRLIPFLLLLEAKCLPPWGTSWHLNI